MQNQESDYHISKYGFLPEQCCDKAPFGFEFVDHFAMVLPETVTSGEKFRSIVNSYNYVPGLNEVTDSINRSQLQFIYSILTMAMNRYIWCTGVNDAKYYSAIPDIIACPLWQVSKKLGIEMALTHATVDLWNWSLIDKNEPFDLDNLKVNHTMTGNRSEEWFYLIMIAIEGVSGRMVTEIPNCHTYFNDDDKHKVKEFLDSCLVDLTKIVKIIKRMYEQCDPDFFFNNLRIYLSGSKNDNLPDGVKLNLEPLGKKSRTIKNIGGSAAQSTLIQMYDCFFGIEHDEHGKTFLDEMRKYMPKSHYEYLRNLEQLPSLKEYVLNSADTELIEKYNDCVKCLKKFRQAHLGLVHKYIMRFVKQPQTEIKSDEQIEPNQNKNAHGTKGSGGQSPVEFCKDLIKTTHLIDINKMKQTKNYQIVIIFSIIVLIFGIWLWH